MTELSVGALYGTVELQTSLFDRGYSRVVKAMSDLGARAERSAAQTTTLDDGLAGVAASADKASTSITRTTQSTTRAAAADQKAAAASTRLSDAQARVAAIMADVADESARVQQATLRVAIAQDRMATTGSADFRRLASAQATLIGSTRSLAAAQEEGAVAGGKFRSGMAGMAKTAGELGLLVGAIEAVKVAIDMTKEANDFRRDMVLVQTNADVTAAEVNKASSALLAMAGPVAAAPNDLATAWYHAKSVGLDYAKSIETTRIAAEGARVGNADLEETMNALTSTVASGIPGVDNMSSAMGQLIAIVGSGDMKLSDLNSFLSSGILTIVKGYGLSLTDVGAAAATFGDNNIRGAHAATMLRMAVQAMAVPVKEGAAELTNLGLSSDTLRKDMEEGGLNKAILDLAAHLKAAKVGAKDVGGVLTEVFGKRAGPGVAVLVSQVDRLESKFKILQDSGASFDQKWKATTQTASFALASLWAGFQAGAITLTEKLGPAIATAVNWLGKSVPHALSVLQGDLAGTEHLVGGAFVGAWHALIAVLGPVADALGTVGHFLAEHQGLTSGVVTGVLAMWAAWKGFQIVSAATRAIRGALLTMRADLGATGSAVRTMWTGAGSQSAMYAAQLKMDLAEVGAAATRSSAEQATAFARQEQAYAELVAASDDATAQQIANSQNAARAAQVAADEQAAAAATAAGAATTAAGEVDAAGMAAGVGWSAALGPLAAVGLGVGLLTGLFSGNTDAATQNKTIMDAYAASLQKSSNALADVNLQATAKNLQDQGAIDLAHQLAAANAGVDVGLGRLTLAINGTSAQYQSLYGSLTKVADANVKLRQGQALPGTQGAVALQTTYNDTGQAAIDLRNKITQLRGDMTKQMKVQQELAQAQHDATVMADGGTSAVARQSRALHLTSAAYINAQQAAKQNTDQTKAQTAAFQAEGDSASLLQQALDGLAGVNLGLAQARTAVRSADLQVLDSFKKSKNAIEGSSKAAVANQQAIQGQVSAAQQLAKSIGDADRKRGEAVKGERDEVASLRDSKKAIEAQLSAQGRLTPAVQAYIDHLYNIKSVGDYLNKHPVTQTVNADTTPADKNIIDVGSKINAIRQSVIPLITANPELANSVATSVQHRINALVGKELTISAKDNATATIQKIQTLESLLRDKSITITTYEKVVGITGPHGTANTLHAGRASGGSAPEGWYWTGEGGVGSRPELNYKRGSNVQVFSFAQSRGIAATMGAKVPGYASGTGPTGRTAETRASSALTGISLDSSSFSWVKFQKQIAAATQSIRDALAAGISHAQYVSLQQRLHRDEQRGRELEHKLGVQAHQEAGKLGRSVSNLHNVASPSDVLAGVHSLEATLRQAGLPRDFIRGLSDENKQIAALVRDRNRAAALLVKANAAMAKARSAEMADFRSFRSATVGGFDITTAGQDANGVVTSGSLLASQTQDLNRTKAWVSGIDKLAGMKIFPAAYLRQLVGAGPSSLGTVRALLAMRHGQLSQFARQERQIFSLGTDVGQHVVARLDTHRLHEADKAVQRAQKREDHRQDRLEHAIGHFAERLEHKLEHLHLEGKLHLTRGELALLVEAGKIENHKRRGHHS